MNISRGVPEILKMADDESPRSFHDFMQITVGRKRLSSATVSKRLKELVSSHILEEVVTRSERGRRIIGYKATDYGKRFLGMLKEFERFFGFGGSGKPSV